MVYGMVSLITSSHDMLWRATLPCSLLSSDREGLATDSPLAKESDFCGSHAKRAWTISVTVYEVQGEVLSRRRTRRRPPVRIDVVKDAMSAG